MTQNHTLPRPFFLRFYAALSTWLTPMWRWALQRRLNKGKETVHSIEQRWVINPPPRPQGTLLWGHAVGVGEALALAGLMRRIGNDRVDLHFLITTTARTSQQALSQQQLGERFTHQFMPVDIPEIVEKFLQHWQPDAAIWCELDLWPALIDATHQRGIPMFLVNARISDKSLAKKRRVRFFYRPLLQRFTALWAQNSASTHALVELGADATKIYETGTIKGFNAPLAVDSEQLALWQALAKKRPIWLLASSHAPEEALALQAHAIVCQTHPNALLIITPRVPDRRIEVFLLLSQHYHESRISRRRFNEELPTTENIYLADTMGEMGLWYRIAPVAMVGGSWADVGGHNPFEATTCGCLVLHGQHTYNFSESYTQLHASGQAILCTDAQKIADCVLQTWQSASSPNHHAASDAVQHATIGNAAAQRAYQAVLQALPTNTEEA